MANYYKFDINEFLRDKTGDSYQRDKRTSIFEVKIFKPKNGEMKLIKIIKAKKLIAKATKECKEIYIHPSYVPTAQVNKHRASLKKNKKK